MNPADTAAPRLLDGPADALCTVVLAHGAGAPMDSLFMAAIASGLAQHGWRVLRFEFAYMARQRILELRQGPDRMPVLQEALRQQVQLAPSASKDDVFLFKSPGGLMEQLNDCLQPCCSS